ncbi:multiple antibiotic resistance protein [Ekhidna lutea]|uniref:UPF0056 membrane protein n=1 Tax=Ekhidna lutea TaxID=447679 RepID=A0A239KH35_EKHLU|nr:MarC family protein [Ekhidna lutea]SNT17706.1 multiple antibiotic resistance protein [Ekhidna lutea]
MSGNLLTFSLSVFTGFFAVMNPISGVPAFLGLVKGRNKEQKKEIAKIATRAAFLIVVFFVLLGKYVFEIFGLTIPAFKITGGILLFYVGFEMLQSKQSSIQHQKDLEPDTSIAITPLAIPLLAGPGTIVTGMNFVTDSDYIHIAIVILIFALIAYMNFVAFSLSDLIIKRIGNNLITVVGKMMGLILAIMGIGMIMRGVKLEFGAYFL